MLVTLDDDGLIAEMEELAVRPMPGLMAVAAALGPRVARRRSRLRGIAVRALIGPLAFVATRGEGVSVKLAAPAPSLRGDGPAPHGVAPHP